MKKKLNYQRALAKFKLFHNGDGKFIIEQILNYDGKVSGDVERGMMWELFHTRDYNKLTQEQFWILGKVYMIGLREHWKGIEHTFHYLQENR